MNLRRLSGLAAVVAAAGLAAASVQAAEVCVDDNLPGRLADAPVRLCLEAKAGQPVHYRLWLAGEVRINGDESAARRGLAGDWFGHPLGLRCTGAGNVRRCDLTVDGEAAWSAELGLPR
ncbi:MULTISPECIES: hypothetical protein [Stenotrophomonas]|uniref:hypothetical protein n=1 Tax=Stenotrophomonas TaxID=40323 RepID=UPI000B638219|nr:MULTISPECIES: hypothetical protein [Stenotrophomonas]SMR83744.1 hypothetical protein SAMN04487863_4024 [Stenotrophomonas sp. yr243]SNT66611.1 hypothetical protein SAMN05518671_4196 [Stenotrophomonas lactitubi]